MKNERKTKKGFFGMLRESFNKTSGCCCGPGETCDGSGKKNGQQAKGESAKTNATVKPAQK